MAQGSYSLYDSPFRALRFAHHNRTQRNQATMKISGFTFLRNGTLMGYPYLESIKSLLPLVDEFVINIGEGNDDTLQCVEAISDPKIRIIRSHWNEGMRSKGFVYAQQK